MWGIREPLVVRDALASGQRLPHPLEVEGESVIWFAVPTLSEQRTGEKRQPGSSPGQSSLAISTRFAVMRMMIDRVASSIESGVYAMTPDELDRFVVTHTSESPRQRQPFLSMCRGESVISGAACYCKWKIRVSF